MTWIAEILTPWLPTDKDDPSNRPQIARDYKLSSCCDATGQARPIPDPNLYVVRVETNGDTLEKINGDENYFVLWSEEQIEEGAEEKADELD